MKKDPFIVDRITFPITKLVDEIGDFHKEANVKEALYHAKSQGLDLVCFDLPMDRNQMPLCKIIDYGRFKYNEEKKAKKIKNEQKCHSKEVRFSPVIDDHDIEYKVKHIKEFLEGGDEVTIVMKFKGRHKKLRNVGEEKLEQIVNNCECEEVSRKSSGNGINVRVKKLNKV